MSSIFSRQPGSSYTDIAYRPTLISQILNASFSRYLQRVFSLYIVCLGSKESGQTRHVRNNFAKIGQRQATEFDIDVLQGKGIGSITFHTKSQSIITFHINTGINTHVFV